MESPHNLGGNYWGTLINSDKSAAPLLEQLCLGLAQLMAGFESSHGSAELVPDKLARFYREVGGNCDALFLETKGPALSFIYQALGCFHTLQPTKNPFEAPSIPALLPMGFVRWQVIQLLLCPDEHSQYLQNAVSRWDVPHPNGGTFPKVIPREAFPETPDQDMLWWHEKVSRQLEKDHVHRNTPRQSLEESVRYYPATNGSREGHPTDYFSAHGNPYRNYDQQSSRAYSDMDDNNRRRRSPDTRRSRLHRFESAFDEPGTSRTSSRNRSPRNKESPASVRIPTRSKTTRARNRDPLEKTSSHRKHRSEPSSDSSNEDSIFPRRRYGSIDDRPPRRSYHLSPGRDPRSRRRHSHDSTTPYYKDGTRDYIEPSDHKRNPESSRSTRYPPPSKMKFSESMFGEPVRPNRDNDATLPYEIKPNIPRVHIRSDGTPVDVHAPSFSNGGRSHSGSSGSDRPRSSSGSGTTNWAPRNSRSRVGRRKTPVYD